MDPDSSSQPEPSRQVRGSGSQPQETEGQPEVLFDRRGHVGIITLNRPRAVNALNHDMVLMVTAQLRAWEHDAGVAHVLIRGAGDRGLCSGGDVVAMYKDMVAGQNASHGFFRDEFTMNHLIFGYSKPIIALQDGLVLGGGVGISALASHRVVTERTRIGMPEVTIGYVPDVGGTWLLGHAGRIGVHAALSGDHVGPGDALALGLSDYFVPSGQLDALADALATESADDVVRHFAQTAPAAELATPVAGTAGTTGESGEVSPEWVPAEWIDECYDGALTGDATAATILYRLELHPDPAAQAAAARILTKSPLSVSVALEAVRRHSTGSLKKALREEFRVAVRCLASHDMREGIRAQVIDKDRNPVWEYPTLTDVSRDLVASYFRPLEPGEADGGELLLGKDVPDPA